MSHCVSWRFLHDDSEGETCVRIILYNTGAEGDCNHSINADVHGYTPSTTSIDRLLPCHVELNPYGMLSSVFTSPTVNAATTQLDKLSGSF